MLNQTIFGVDLPDAGPVFTVALGVHVLAGMTAVVAGTLAATARKRPGRHPIAGTVFLWALGTIVATATVMATIRFREDWHLLAIAVVAGRPWPVRLARAPPPSPGWVTRHAVGMGGSFVALLTGFYVDNGPQLPLWQRLPHWSFWFLPTVIGAPLIWWACHRFRRGVSSRPRATAGTARRPPVRH